MPVFHTHLTPIDTNACVSHPSLPLCADCPSDAKTSHPHKLIQMHMHHSHPFVQAVPRPPSLILMPVFHTHPCPCAHCFAKTSPIPIDTNTCVSHPSLPRKFVGTLHPVFSSLIPTILALCVQTVRQTPRLRHVPSPSTTALCPSLQTPMRIGASTTSS
jgi:hypothetical protein